MNKLTTSLLLFLMLIPITTFSEAWQNKVSFEIPASWELLNTKSTNTAIAKIYFVKKDVIASETHFSNAMLQYYPLPASVTMMQADNIVASHSKDATLILSAQDGPDWKTYILINRERNEQYVALYRIGIIDGICLELMLVFPNVAGKTDKNLSLLTLNPAFVTGKEMVGIYVSQSDVKDMVDVFNAVCNKLKISGKGQYNANVIIMAPPAKPEKIFRYKGENNDTK